MAAGLGVAAFVGGRGAHAQPRPLPPRAVHLDYAAPAGCPTDAMFAGELRERSPRIVLTRDGDAMALDVTVRRHEGRIEGRVVVREPHGAPTQRAVEGETCGEVVSALALIAAVAVDPTASTRPSPAPTTDANVTAAPLVAKSAAEEPAATDGATLRLSVGAHAGLSGGVTPRVLVSAPVFVELAHGRDALVAPALRLRFEHAGSGTVHGAGGGALFAWTTASVDACPFAWAPARVRLSPCLRVESGALHASGVDVAASRSDTRLWFALGAVARAQRRITGPLFAELEVGASVPLVRDRFFFEPDRTLFRAPIVGWSAAAGLGVAFW